MYSSAIDLLIAFIFCIAKISSDYISPQPTEVDQYKKNLLNLDNSSVFQCIK